MLLIRMCYTADLPTPDEVIRRLTGHSAQQTNHESFSNESAHSRSVPDSSAQADGPPMARRTAGSENATPAGAPMPAKAQAPDIPRLQSFADIVALAA
jgi:DNA polymerase-3 subunit gamma/tau